MLVMPSTAVIVSQPLTNRFCTVVKYDNGSLDDSINVKKCSPILKMEEKRRRKIVLSKKTEAMKAIYSYRIVQNARSTHGTFKRCHSFSTSADKPKLVAKFFACS